MCMEIGEGRFRYINTHVNGTNQAANNTSEALIKWRVFFTDKKCISLHIYRLKTTKEKKKSSLSLFTFEHQCL